MGTKSTDTPPYDNSPLASKAQPSAHADIVLGLFIAAAAIILYILTTTWKPSAAVFPRIVATLLLALGSMNAWQGFQRRDAEGQARFLPEPMGFLKIWVAIPIYFVGVWLIGFPLATILLTVGLSTLFGFQKRLQSLLAGVIFVAVMLAVFTGLFDRPLPNGFLFSSLIN